MFSFDHCYRSYFVYSIYLIYSCYNRHYLPSLSFLLPHITNSPPQAAGLVQATVRVQTNPIFVYVTMFFCCAKPPPSLSLASPLTVGLRYRLSFLFIPADPLFYIFSLVFWSYLYLSVLNCGGSNNFCIAGSCWLSFMSRILAAGPGNRWETEAAIGLRPLGFNAGRPVSSIEDKVEFVRSVYVRILSSLYVICSWAYSQSKQFKT